MKKFIFLTLTFISNLCFAQNNELFSVFKNGKWGAINQNNEIVVPLNYHHTQILYNYCLAKNKNKYGLFKPSGELLLKFNSDKIKFLSNQLILLYRDRSIYLYNLSKETISSAARQNDFNIIETGIYSLVTNENLKIIDAANNKVFSFDADYISSLKSNQTYGKTMADFFTSEEAFYFLRKNDKWGVISDDFKALIPIQFDDIKLESNWLKVYNNNSFGLFDFEGKELLACNCTRLQTLNTSYSVEIDGKLGYYDKDFNMLLPHQYNKIERPAENLLIVSKDNFDGVADDNGRILIRPNKFNNLKVLNNRFLEYNQNSNRGIVTKHGRIIYTNNSAKFYNLSDIGFAIKKDTLFGFVNFQGREVIEPQFKRIRKLNDRHLLVQKGKKFGVVSTSGKGVIPVEYAYVFATEHDNIFEVHGFKYRFLSKADIKSILGVDIPGSSSNVEVKEFQWGIINSSGEILLDTVYFRPQIAHDYDNFAIKVRQKNGMLVVNYDDKGKLIEKLNYKNYINFKVRNYSLSYNWRQNPKKNSLLWGLFSNRGNKIIDYQFQDKRANLFGIPELYLTSVRTKRPALENTLRIGNNYKTVSTPHLRYRYGIVNKAKGKQLLVCNYIAIDSLDFNYAHVARCVRSSTKFELIDNSGNKVGKSYAYIDDFKSGLARINSGGELELSLTKTYNLRTPLYQSEGMKIFDGTNYALECKGGRWGVMDSTGQVIIEPHYHFLQKHYRNEFIAKKGSKWGVIYPNDTVKIPFKFDEIRYFYDESKEFAWSARPIYKIKIGKLWGVADEQGNLILDAVYHDIKLLDNPDGLFFAVKQNNLWGVRSENGSEIVPTDFNRIEYLSPQHKMYFKATNTGQFAGFVDKAGKIQNNGMYYTARSFKNNYAAVAIAKNKWNFVNRNFELTAKRNFKEVRNVSENKAAVKTQSGWGFISTSGKELTPFYYEAASDFHCNRAMVQITYPAKLLGLIKRKTLQGYINELGKMQIKPKFRKAYDFSHGNAIVYSTQRKYGLINENGQFLLPCKFRSIETFNRYGSAVIVNDKREYGLIDSLGNFLVPFGKYSKIENFSEGLAVVKSGNKYGFINYRGKETVKPIYRDAAFFSCNRAAVKSGRDWFYINRNGKKVSDKYKKAGNYKNGYAKVDAGRITDYYVDTLDWIQSVRPVVYSEGIYIEKNFVDNKFFFSDSEYRNIFNLRFDEIRPFENGLAIVKNNNKYGLLNKEGYYIIPPSVNNIHAFSQGFAVFEINQLHTLYNSNGKLLIKDKYNGIEAVGNNKVKLTNLNEIKYLPVTPDK